VPWGAGQRAWLLGVARRVVSNQRRSARRRQNLVERLMRRRPEVASTADTSVTDGTGDRVLSALGTLRPLDQEALRLRAWDGLTHAEIAVVLGSSETSVTVRLSRARRHLETALAKVDALRMSEEQDKRGSTP
jgi:RNA polymerase sigma-70 factor (ECF subfamily)